MKTKSRKMRTGRSGFTLVELLVSVALTVFMLTLFATLFSAGNDAVRIARGTSEVDRTVQSAITKLRRDLQFVYVGDNVSLGKAFSAPDQIPTAGYFTIEENMPGSPPYYLSDANAASKIQGNAALQAFVQAIQSRVGFASGATTLYRQGIDERGLPVEVDVDDVLAFTVKLTANSPENVFYGKVPIGSILDSDLDPGSRFDQPDNGIFTSPYAEIIYFLRPSRPYSVAEINRPSLGTDNGRNSNPATYTLHRRELLMVSPEQREMIEKKFIDGYGYTSASILSDMDRIQKTSGAAIDYLKLNPSLQQANGSMYNPSFYHNYDVSVYFGYDRKKDPGALTTPTYNNYSYFSLRLNDPMTVRLRQNRYGMQWILPLSSIAINQKALLISPDAAAPAYDHPFLAGSSFRIFVPGADVSWHGRPTLYESTLIGNTWGSAAVSLMDGAYNPSIFSPYDNPARLNLSDPRFSSDLIPPASARRADGDVLLANVLSFDVKVLNDDMPQGLLSPTAGGTALDVDPITFQPWNSADPLNWPGARTSVLPPFEQHYDMNQKSTSPVIYRAGTFGVNASRPWMNDPVYTGGLPMALLQSDFIDIGYGLATELPTNLATGSPRCYWDSSIVPSGSVFAIMPAASLQSVPWGSQTPARWSSTGRTEGSAAYYNSLFGSSYQPLRSVYDTWAPEYQPELFTNNLLANPPSVPSGYLPPYDRPIRGLQITIRILEPKTGLTRDFQVVHRFN